MEYRHEIDGLRALAVLPVILFHGNLLGVSGGYVGVDVFFVISGYLITLTIIEELRRGQFSIGGFYERRARRILPALSVVLLFTTIAAYILMPPIYLKAYSQSLVSAATFSSNVFFSLTGGYFSTASAEKPLLHIWSLAIEEQYYVVFPLLVSTLWFISRNWLNLFVFFLALGSFLFAQYLTNSDSIEANYYSIFSRAWELLAGSLVALLGKPDTSIAKLIRNAIKPCVSRN